jgi:SHAQKYF class myb-like DNA-binding protein
MSEENKNQKSNINFHSYDQRKEPDFNNLLENQYQHTDFNLQSIKMHQCNNIQCNNNQNNDNYDKDYKDGSHFIFKCENDIISMKNYSSKTSNNSKTNKTDKTLRTSSVFTEGNWTKEEHKIFLDALMKYGVKWKLVEKHIGTRSSHQARSHAQKFFDKVKFIKPEFSDVNSLYKKASELNDIEYKALIEELCLIEFERKKHYKKRRDNSPSSTGKSDNTKHLM